MLKLSHCPSSEYGKDALMFLLVFVVFIVVVLFRDWKLTADLQRLNSMLEISKVRYSMTFNTRYWP